MSKWPLGTQLEKLVIASKLGTSIGIAMLLAASAVSQAQQAPQASSAVAAASATPAVSQKATVAGPAAAKSSTDTQTSDSGLSAALVKEARDDGFVPVKRHNLTVYCKSEVLVGTAFPIRTCYNADRLKLRLEQMRGN
jgi:hypothetical protein